MMARLRYLLFVQQAVSVLKSKIFGKKLTYLMETNANTMTDSLSKNAKIFQSEFSITRNI